MNAFDGFHSILVKICIGVLKIMCMNRMQFGIFHETVHEADDISQHTLILQK